MTSYLVFPDLADAAARSNQQATANGCAAGTQYWWALITNASTGQAALVIGDSGAYGPSGLSAAEQVALVSLSPSDPNWFPSSGD